MKKIKINHTELAYELAGDGEALLFLHPGFVADAMQPLFNDSALREYKRINYHRRGYGESAPATLPFEIAQQTQDVLALLDTLEIERAHLAGHSFGANIALDVALTAPERVESLALLEPPLPFAMAPETLGFMMNVMGGAVEKFVSGDREGGVTDWLTGAFGPGFQEVMERTLPGSTKQMVPDGFAAIAVEGPALQTWAVTPADIARIQQPVLSVFHIDPYFNGFQQVHEALMQWLPQCEALVIPNTTHLLQIAQPRAVAEGLAAFLARQRERLMA